jgi:hypothetical protein
MGIGALKHPREGEREIQVGKGALSSKYNILEREGERYRWE